MNTDLWWLWIVLGFIFIAFVIFLVGSRKETTSPSMAHPAPHGADSTHESPIDENHPGSSDAGHTGPD